ncbi:MAG: hypothetical protein COX19_17785 [Desulfobacterales bacterium CG23_combo_of_CG06-09_8_20_14_all_51_8]|nr:MAG: hypothetical protein COX19_17785 [Desulfobacterales bacterium CG23_combo_of_CG06-09_8_20_14_all_51_8]
MSKQPKLSDEIAKMAEEYEPLMPVEKKLIAYSLILGTALIGILLFVSYTFFPSGH